MPSGSGMPDFGAMMWVIVISSTVVPLLIAAVVIFFVARMFLKGQGRRNRLAATGVRARATVLGVSDTGVTLNDNPRAKIDLLVEPQGAPAFTASVTQTVSRLAIPRVNDLVAVQYDPAQPSDIMLLPGVAPPAV